MVLADFVVLKGQIVTDSVGWLKGLGSVTHAPNHAFQHPKNHAS